jgi:hypothetical protein
MKHPCVDSYTHHSKTLWAIVGSVKGEHTGGKCYLCSSVQSFLIVASTKTKTHKELSDLKQLMDHTTEFC